MFLQTSVDFQRTIRRYIPQDSTLHNHRWENLKSCMSEYYFSRKKSAPVQLYKDRSTACYHSVPSRLHDYCPRIVWPQIRHYTAQLLANNYSNAKTYWLFRIHRTFSFSYRLYYAQSWYNFINSFNIHFQSRRKYFLSTVFIVCKWTSQLWTLWLHFANKHIVTWRPKAGIVKSE
jgi:hypothetical protein